MYVTQHQAVRALETEAVARRLTDRVGAQHLLTADHRHSLLKDLYAVDLVRDGERRVIRRLHIDNVWYTGEPESHLRRLDRTEGGSDAVES